MFSRPTILDLHHQHTILLVEDDPDARSAVAELLRLDGYNVLEAGDARKRSTPWAPSAVPASSCST
jgi:CheY-like chemotaxis protein